MKLNMQFSSKKRKGLSKQPITQKTYLDWVEAMPTSTPIKDKFRALVNKMPTTAFKSVMQNQNEYIIRFEQEINRELLGIVELPQDSTKAFLPVMPIKESENTGVQLSWDDEITLTPINEVIDGNESKEDRSEKAKEGTAWNTEKEEEHWPTPSNSGADSDQGRPTTGGPEWTTHNIHPAIPDGGVGVLRSGSELSTGHQQSEESSPATEVNNNDRLRILHGSPTRIQSVHLSEERPCESGPGDSECTGTGGLGLPGTSECPTDQREQESNGG